MPNIWAIVPVKAFHLAKQRLASVYLPYQRRELARAMLEDVLAALSQVNGIAGIALITLDREAKRLAREHGAEAFDEEAGSGFNEAVTAAARRLVRERRGSMLVVAGDIPGVTGWEIEILLASNGGRRGLTLVPAHDREGTNALVMTPPDAMPLSFGIDSFTRHLLAGRAAGLEPMVLPLPNIGLDLDHPEDVATFAGTPSPTKTWRYLLSQGLATAARVS